MFCPINNTAFVAIKMGRRQGGLSRTGGMSGAYLNRYVTDPALAGQPPAHFHRNLRSVPLALFPPPRRILTINSDMLVVSASAARTALKNSQLTDGESQVIYGTGR